jgi:hypothetical protein
MADVQDSRGLGNTYACDSERVCLSPPADSTEETHENALDYFAPHHTIDGRESIGSVIHSPDYVRPEETKDAGEDHNHFGNFPDGGGLQ